MTQRAVSPCLCVSVSNASPPNASVIDDRPLSHPNCLLPTYFATFRPAGSLNVMRRKSTLLALSLLLLLAPFAPQAEGSRRRGALILSGGGGTSRESFGPGVLEQFVALAGGPGA